VYLFVRHLLLSLVLSGFACHVFGQDLEFSKSSKNSIYLEGATLIYTGMYSVSYERSFLSKSPFKMYFATGLGGWYFIKISRNYFGYSLPFSLNSIFGSGKVHPEVDFGFRYTFFNKNSAQDISPFFPLFNIGFRYQEPNLKKIIFRSYIGLSGMGIGLGWSF